MEHLESVDPEVYAAVRAEAGRQSSQLELIASENFVSKAVLEAMGTVLTNKYAEGLPGKRYYGGCEHVDIVEDLARDRAKRLFGADHANEAGCGTVIVPGTAWLARHSFAGASGLGSRSSAFTNSSAVGSCSGPLNCAGSPAPRGL